MKWGDLTKAVLQAMRESREAAFGNTGILFAEVCRIKQITDPAKAPNLGSIYRIWRRHRNYGQNWWNNK